MLDLSIRRELNIAQYANDENQVKLKSIHYLYRLCFDGAATALIEEAATQPYHCLRRNVRAGINVS
jgi:hypothetical protein